VCELLVVGMVMGGIFEVVDWIICMFEQ